jgi:hypothetical protein
MGMHLSAGNPSSADSVFTVADYQGTNIMSILSNNRFNLKSNDYEINHTLPITYKIRSTSNAGNGITSFYIGNNVTANALEIDVTGSGFTPSGHLETDAVHLVSARPNGVLIGTRNVSGSTRIMSGGAVASTFSSSQMMRLHAYGAGTLVSDGSGNITSSSDRRLKDSISTYKRGLDDIVKLKPYLFKWNQSSGLDTNDVNAGFFAQQVNEAIPEAVFYNAARDSYSIADRPIIAALVNAIIELKARIVQLEN